MSLKKVQRKFAILLFKKTSQATWSNELIEKFPKKLPHFEEKSFEISKIFGGCGQILVVPQHVIGILDFLFL
jgi:hypothetical protein